MEDNINKKTNIVLNLTLLGLSIAGFVLENYILLDGFVKETLKLYSKPVGVTAIINIVAFVFANRKYIRAYLLSKTKFKNKHLRLSLSYLYRIKVKDKYLLVKSHRIKDQFQPVGGVYKYYPEFREILYNKLEILDDNCIPLDETNKSDLRLRIKGKHLIEFLKWYDSKVGRETSPWREFYEELVQPNILPHSVFPHVPYRSVTTKVLPFTFSKHYDCHEYKIYDIFEPILNEEQAQAIEALSKNTNDYNGQYIWVDEDCIKKLGYDGKIKVCNIGEHTEFIL